MFFGGRMRAELIQNDKYNQMTLGGDLSIVNMSELKTQMDALYAEGKEVHLSFIEVESVDISFIQLLISSYITFDSAGIVFQIHGDVPDSFNDKCNMSGFSNSILPLFP